MSPKVSATKSEPQVKLKVDFKGISGFEVELVLKMVSLRIDVPRFLTWGICVATPQYTNLNAALGEMGAQRIMSPSPEFLVTRQLPIHSFRCKSIPTCLGAHRPRHVDLLPRRHICIVVEVSLSIQEISVWVRGSGWGWLGLVMGWWL